jgi:hypothetical protein
VRSEFTILIADQVLGLFVPGRGFTQLLCNPFVSGISGDPGMHATASVQFHDDENVDGPEDQIMSHGEITGPDVLEMVLEKCGPRLT